MDLLPSQEQLELTGLASEFFADQLPISRIRERRADPAAITRETWAAAAHAFRVIAAGSPRRSLIRLIGSWSAKNSEASPASSSCS
ncbi:MAG TPA: hypothetical protein VME40_20040 [Caulobacteraceae bacterium]|nr:hypothetical protein [Caulobacteraceae bacterium]